MRERLNHACLYVHIPLFFMDYQWKDLTSKDLKDRLPLFMRYYYMALLFLLPERYSLPVNNNHSPREALLQNDKKIIYRWLWEYIYLKFYVRMSIVSNINNNKILNLFTAGFFIKWEIAFFFIFLHGEIWVSGSYL